MGAENAQLPLPCGAAAAAGCIFTLGTNLDYSVCTSNKGGGFKPARSACTATRRGTGALASSSGGPAFRSHHIRPPRAEIGFVAVFQAYRLGSSPQPSRRIYRCDTHQPPHRYRRLPCALPPDPCIRITNQATLRCCRLCLPNRQSCGTSPSRCCWRPPRSRQVGVAAFRSTWTGLTSMPCRRHRATPQLPPTRRHRRTHSGGCWRSWRRVRASLPPAAAAPPYATVFIHQSCKCTCSPLPQPA
jgi:hypothetical protein